MIHGKAKQMFEEWYLSNNKHYDKLTVIDAGKLNQFYNLPLVCQQGLIVNWLDTFDEIGGKNIFYILFDEFSKSNSISEATQKAIEKSIEILNSRL